MGFEVALVGLVMLAPVAITLIFLRYRTAVTKERYRTLLALADKGVELPQEMLAEHRAPEADRRRGLVLVSGGLGLMVMFRALPIPIDGGQGLPSLWGLGLLPLMVGLGYLASWWLNRRDDMRD